VDEIVHNHNILEFSVLDDPQILDIESVVSFHTILAMQNTMDRLFLLVQILDNGLSVVHRGGRENVNRVQLVHLLQEFEAVGSDIELELIALDCKGYVGFFASEHRVDEGLIQIQHEEFLLGV
jgi:hypothetical protein